MIFCLAASILCTLFLKINKDQNEKNSTIMNCTYQIHRAKLIFVKNNVIILAYYFSSFSVSDYLESDIRVNFFQTHGLVSYGVEKMKTLSFRMF